MQIGSTEGLPSPKSIKSVAATALRAILVGRQGAADINDLVGACHSLAVPYVRRRLTGESILRRTLNMDISDFAYDCVADLFAFAETGDFPHIHAYFAAYKHETMSDEEMLMHLRRLVFSQANQNLFRLYNEVDPSLGKILRNVKLALQQFDSLVLTERFGEPCLAPAAGDYNLTARAFGPEELEHGLRRYLRGTENIPFMLGKLSLFLVDQNEFSRLVPLVVVAVAFRAVYMRHPEDEETAKIVEDKLDASYLSVIVGDVLQNMREKKGPLYSKKKRIRPDLLDIYFKVIEERLTRSYSGDGNEKGLRELLSEKLAGLTEKEYRSTHRNQLEYLSRLTGDEVAKRLKER